MLFHSTVISAAERESAYVIDGLMHNDVVKSDVASASYLHPDWGVIWNVNIPLRRSVTLQRGVQPNDVYGLFRLRKCRSLNGRRYIVLFVTTYS